ncbi:MAG TPA: ARMT1-like domain-containing protein [Tepidisphaeraceae bacterium]|jgi:type II pantothenate kinase
MSPFTLLADPDEYVASPWDLTTDAEGRGYWCDFFKRHLRTILQLAREMTVARAASLEDFETRARACEGEFDGRIDNFWRHPTAFGYVGILTLDEWRDSILARHGFEDPFLDLKNRENEKMLPLLAHIGAQLDLIKDPPHRFRLAIEGVFAGNIFDMGAAATAKAFMHESPDFLMVRSRLKPRPWLVDDYDTLALRVLNGPRYRKIVFFIDNAGSDFLLGALPLMNYFMQRDAQVVLAANEKPSLNDMTIHDVRAWWPRIIKADQTFDTPQLQLVSTGTGAPLIDLSRVSDELNAAAEDADLVILEGMGRGVESNFDATFRVDALNIAMLKDPAVAKRIGGQVFDLVCKFQSPSTLA